MQMGMASAMYTAETAHIQGVDLWAEEQARLTAAMEFHSRWILTKARECTRNQPLLVNSGKILTACF
jgi:hypothetical protein